MNPYWRSSCGRYTIFHGDCLEILPTLTLIDCFVTDSPYGINTKSDGQGKLSPWADLCNSAYWYAAWIGACRSRLSPSGCLWAFMNWRSMVTFQKASCDIGWAIESMLIWDKEWIGPGGSRGLRPSYEMVGLWGAESFSIDNRGIPDIQRFKWSGFKPTGHPAEKPTELCRWLLDQSTAPGAIVADPFMGSGSSGVAAAQRGRRFVGIELDERWCEASARRIEREATHLFAEPEPAKPDHPPLFDLDPTPGPR